MKQHKRNRTCLNDEFCGERHLVRHEGCLARNNVVLWWDVFLYRNWHTLWTKPTWRSEEYLVYVSHDHLGVMVKWMISKKRLGVLLWWGDLESSPGGWQEKSNKSVCNCKNLVVGWSNMLLVVLVENLNLKGEDWT